jgi:XTP/dITP diphosphohydrolase
MQMKLIFATNNQHKVREIREALGGTYEIISLKEAGIDKEIPEPHDTLEANASEKSGTIYALTGLNCFSEDTGLEVEALQGMPGVLSARYAGENASFADNVEKLLSEMRGQENRKARFRTIISLINNGEESRFEGVCEGRITDSPSGTDGFGYDPVFVPEGADRTFAEMSLEEKNRYSHRARAVQKLVLYLNNQIVRR